MLQNSGQIATARWADPDYIVDRYYFRPGDIWIGRNPHNFDQAIGYKDDRHVLLCAGSRAGKGRSLIVNNLALWPGSTVVYDPKGELPSILADRRGQGDDQHCEGMGQDVFVLDPLNHAEVDPSYRAYFDPLSGLDPEDRDGELATWAKRIADSLIQYNDGTEASEWAKRAVRFTALIIMHVVTSPSIPENKRNLITVLHYVLEGAEDIAQNLRSRMAPEVHDKIPDPMIILVDEMIDNDACRGWIAKEARNLKRQVQRTPKFFESVRGEAADKLDWFKSAGIERAITGGLNGVQEMPSTRQFDPKRLKTDPKGISVFVVMPVDDLKTYGPWLEAVFTGIFAAMRQVPGKPATNHQVLTILDEFSSLGYQEYIASSLDNIAGAGMKLMIVLQNFGKMKKLYGDEMESFFSNAGLEIYFGKIGQTAAKYVTEELGETEIVKLVRNVSTSQTTSTATSEASAYGHTEGEGENRSRAKSQSSARSRGNAWNWSNGTNWSDTKNWGESEGRSMGKNYGPHIFFKGFADSHNFGTSFSKNHGSSHTNGGSKVKGGSRSEQFTDTQGTSETIGSSWNRSTTTTNTSTKTQTEGYQIGGGVAETFHKKPLLEPHEINSYLGAFEQEDRDHPAYPGLALVRIQREAPFFVRRSNYDQDPYFERCFAADPVHGFIPLDQQPMLGYQYTPDHLLEIALPDVLHQPEYKGQALVRRFQWVDKDTEVFSVSENSANFRAPCVGRVVGKSQQLGNDRLTIRFDEVLDQNITLGNFFQPHINRYLSLQYGGKVDKRINLLTQLEREDEEFFNNRFNHFALLMLICLTPLIFTMGFLIPIIGWIAMYHRFKKAVQRRKRLDSLYNDTKFLP